jgi:hypothetical protein
MGDFAPNQIRRLDGGLLLVFRELLRTRRASAVAERLGLSQSAINHSLGRLRDLFDDPCSCAGRMGSSRRGGRWNWGRGSRRGWIWRAPP